LAGNRSELDHGKTGNQSKVADVQKLQWFTGYDFKRIFTSAGITAANGWFDRSGWKRSPTPFSPGIES
jgi:hypothetical protein